MRIALFLFDCPDTQVLEQTLDRIPPEADEWIEQVVVVQDRPEKPQFGSLSHTAAARGFRLAARRPPRASGAGALRKDAFEYAVAEGLDFAIVMRASLHPAEQLVGLIQAASARPRAVFLVSRDSSGQETREPGAPFWARVARSAASAVQRSVLRVEWRDPQSSFRLYPVAALRAVPFQLNADDALFDAQILIQLRALGAPIEEASASADWREFETTNQRLAHAAGAALAALDYRGHQLHLSRRHRYMVDEGIHYTLKKSATGSHMQIVDAIRPGARVLDLGCSQGLLAAPLAERSASVTGVDAGPGEHLAEELAAYHQRDLEGSIELPEGRVFDYVVIADVIEHVRNREQLLRTARRFLKEDGRLIISTPNIAIWFYRLSLLVGRFEYGPRGILDEDHVHLFTRATFRREVEAGGFEILGQRVSALPFEVVFRSTGRSAWIRRLATAYHALARLWPSMFAYQFILEAKITTLDEEGMTG